jgi:parallel beta-helix repeat protein
MICDNCIAENIYVDDTNSEGPWDGSMDNPFGSIQDGIDQAQINDVIIIQNGDYNEELVIDKAITLKGENKGFTNLIGSQVNETFLQLNNCDNVTITGFTFKNLKNAIYMINTSDTIIYNNTFKNNSFGINITNASSNSLIYENNFIDNSINAYDLSNTTQWDYSSRGNYWDDYTGVDSNNDDIGDTSYTVDGFGNNDSYPLIIINMVKPVSMFDYSPLTPNTQDEVFFNDASYDSDGFIVNWTWDFDDGEISYLKNSSHYFNDDGYYDVSLTVTDNYGLVHTSLKNIYIKNSYPVASFTINLNPATDLDNVVFDSTSIDYDGEIVEWSWSIDGTIFSSNSTFSYQFPDDGEYEIMLYVIDDDSAKTITKKNIEILNVEPIAQFSYSSDLETITIEASVNFNDYSKDLDGTIEYFKWDFGDGATSTEKSPKHQYATKGVYNVKLTVGDDDGATSIVERLVTVTSDVEEEDLLKGVNILDFVFIIFIIVMIIVIIIISKKYGYR